MDDAVLTLIVGVLIVALLMTLRKLRRVRHMRVMASPPGAWLNRECVVTIGHRSYLATVTAVSSIGAVEVTGKTRRTRQSVWLGVRDVESCVRWL